MRDPCVTGSSGLKVMGHVLDDGTITAEDTHRNLLATDEDYCLAVVR
jgi:hypothetical protein